MGGTHGRSELGARAHYFLTGPEAFSSALWFVAGSGPFRICVERLALSFLGWRQFPAAGPRVYGPSAATFGTALHAIGQALVASHAYRLA